MSTTREQAERARRAFLKLSTTANRTAILSEIASALEKNTAAIFEANQKDLAEAKNSIAEPLYKRLIFNESKLRDVVEGIRQLARMDDPLGRVLEQKELDDGLILRKVQTPIGVIATIFESRPDAGPQIATLAIRTGNAVLLKGGREAASTNAALVDTLRGVLEKHGVADAVQLVSTREQIAEFLKMDDLIDLVIPRGSNEMVRTIQQSTKIPVLGHADGVCHVYIDEFADPEKATRITVDSKAQYPAVCNAAETLLVHSKFPAREKVLKALSAAGVELRDSGFGSEYLDFIMNNAAEVLKAIEEYAIECSILKVFGSETLDFVVDEAVQVYGGYGYSAEYPVERYYRDSRVNRIFEGTNEINRLLIPGMLLKRAAKGQLPLHAAARAVVDEVMSASMSNESTGPAQAKKALLFTAGAALQRFGEGIRDEQEVLMRSADNNNARTGRNCA